MTPEQIQNLISMAFYLAAVVVIGIVFAQRASSSVDEYFIGGRGLGPWVAAFSAEASDMSGWLLMGLPGLAYWTGLADPFWTALGLAAGTYVNWLIVAKRLRKYSLIANDSITIPDFFSNRFHEKRPVLLFISSVFILVFFAVYTASCFKAGGKLFEAVFGQSYHMMLIMTSLFVFAYTLLGGFWAESVTDFVQAVLMIFALVMVVLFGLRSAGGIGAVVENVKNIPGFLEFFGVARPVIDGAGVQLIIDGAPRFAKEAPVYGGLSVLSTLAWGLGYFGMPQVLLRFVAIRKTRELITARRIATAWCVVSLIAAVFVGILGRALVPSDLMLNTATTAENIFVVLSEILFHPLLAGIVMAGILAAAMSSSDSYLLIASSAVAKNIYQGILKKEANDAAVMRIGRVALTAVAVVGLAIAWDADSKIFDVVSFAWAGFGAAFGPLMLLSLFWKRTTRAGAIAGILGGGAMVFLWKLVFNAYLAETYPIFGLYELLPAFIFSLICIVAVSLISKPPSKEIEDEFYRAKLTSM
ncbi:MAG: sodium/proline symporter PutP [Oscillospiraceae bacterium]|jgi:sodium/proline symporter|nr:sodium/proline symporter PutP [Oscillospiraceae bacterium]